MSDVPEVVVKFERVNPATLIAHPRNSNSGDVGALSESLGRFGMYRPIVVQRSTRHVLAGNHVLQAAIANGMRQVAVGWVDVDDETALAILVGDNQLARLALNDDAALAEVLTELAQSHGLEGTGFDGDDLDALLYELEHRDEALGGSVADPWSDRAFREAPESQLTEPGDRWLCGDHVVVCGDSTDAATFDIALGKDSAQMLWTDPPYGIDYGGGLALERERLLGDERAGLEALLRATLGNALGRLDPGSTTWIASPGLAPLRVFLDVADDLGILRQTLVWVKDSAPLSRADYHYRHELLIYGWAPGAAHQGPPDATGTTVWEFARPKVSDLHPTMKPVDLVARAIERHTERGAVILDCFAGAGATLIAAERERRRAVCIERDPGYVETICRRWQEATGQLPVLERLGRTVDLAEGVGSPSR